MKKNELTKSQVTYDGQEAIGLPEERLVVCRERARLGVGVEVEADDIERRTREMVAGVQEVLHPRQVVAVISNAKSARGRTISQG